MFGAEFREAILVRTPALGSLLLPPARGRRVLILTPSRGGSLFLTRALGVGVGLALALGFFLALSLGFRFEPAFGLRFRVEALPLRRRVLTLPLGFRFEPALRFGFSLEPLALGFRFLSLAVGLGLKPLALRLGGFFLARPLRFGLFSLPLRLCGFGVALLVCFRETLALCVDFFPLALRFGLEPAALFVFLPAALFVFLLALGLGGFDLTFPFGLGFQPLAFGFGRLLTLALGFGLPLLLDFGTELLPLAVFAPGLLGFGLPLAVGLGLGLTLARGSGGFFLALPLRFRFEFPLGFRLEPACGLRFRLEPLALGFCVLARRFGRFFCFLFFLFAPLLRFRLRTSFFRRGRVDLPTPVLRVGLILQLLVFGEHGQRHVGHERSRGGGSARRRRRRAPLERRRPGRTARRV